MGFTVQVAATGNIFFSPVDSIIRLPLSIAYQQSNHKLLDANPCSLIIYRTMAWDQVFGTEREFRVLEHFGRVDFQS